MHRHQHRMFDNIPAEFPSPLDAEWAHRIDKTDFPPPPPTAAKVSIAPIAAPAVVVDPPVAPPKKDIKDLFTAFDEDKTLGSIRLTLLRIHCGKELRYEGVLILGEPTPH